MNKFKIGDRVKVKECSYEQGISCIGHEGIIVNIDYNYDYFYTIKFDSGFIPAHANCYRDDELILLPKKRNKPTKQKELIATAFKIGDRVKVKRCVPDCRCIGHTGVIIRVEENNHFPYIIKFDDEFNSSHVNCYKTKELILLPKKRTKSVKQKELTAIAYELIDLIEAYKNGKRDGYQKGYEAGRRREEVKKIMKKKRSPQKHSPIVLKTMPFTKALDKLIGGKKITKLEWGNKDIYGLLKDEKLMIHRDTGFHQWVLSEADMIGDDWMVIK